MTSAERVLAACSFQRPDRIPVYESFWDFPDSWVERFGAFEDLSDLIIWVPDETTYPTRRKRDRKDGEWVYEIDGWGQELRRKENANFSEVIQAPLADMTDIDSVAFDPADMDERYLNGHETAAGLEAELAEAKKHYAVFGKTGGPYLRSTFVRGEVQFLMDIALDPGLGKAIADKMADHLIGIGVEQIKRWKLQDTGICINDDMAGNKGPMFSPKTFEQVFLPAYRRMIKAYKDAGARYVLLHSDGDIGCLLSMLVDAGIDGINPLERRANMNPMEIRKQFPKLIIAGGMDNSDTLINGPISRIEAEARELIDLGRDGGVIIGAHSISPEVSIEHYAAYRDVCLTYGDFTA
jgi:Uroporphyrinogen decarboxylase (URO-D)